LSLVCTLIDGDMVSIATGPMSGHGVVVDRAR
jgi:hypothetical protein